MFKKTILSAIMEYYSNLRVFYNTEEEFIQHLLSGEVTMPVKDILKVFDNFKGENIMTLPSGHQINDIVDVSFDATRNLRNCKIIKVHFSESKVLYDVEISGQYEQTGIQPTGTWTTRLYNVDSVFVTKG